MCAPCSFKPTRDSGGVASRNAAGWCSGFKAAKPWRRASGSSSTHLAPLGALVQHDWSWRQQGLGSKLCPAPTTHSLHLELCDKKIGDVGSKALETSYAQLK
jgi:hypothetical protein